jgi:hypothetical protein
VELDAALLFVAVAEFELFMSDGVLPALAAVPVLSDGVVVLACGGVELGVVLSGLVALGFVVLGLFGFVVVSGLVADGVVDCGVVVVVVVVVLVVVESGVVVAELCWFVADGFVSVLDGDALEVVVLDWGLFGLLMSDVFDCGFVVVLDCALDWLPYGLADVVEFEGLVAVVLELACPWSLIVELPVEEVAGCWFCAISVPAAAPASPLLAEGLPPVLAEQCSETCFTSVTWKLLPLELPVEPAVELVLLFSPVLELAPIEAEFPAIAPVTCTSCPTCGCNLLVSPERL